MSEWDYIKPLAAINRNGTKGRPSQWYDGIATDYDKHRREGIDHAALLRQWRVENHSFKNWLGKDKALMLTYHHWLGVDAAKPVETPVIEAIEYTKDNLRRMASEALQDLIINMKARPSAYKPQEIITACREALDRTEGKAAQSITVDSKATITHEHILKLEPSEAYKRMIEGDLEVIDHVP